MNPSAKNDDYLQIVSFSAQMQTQMVRKYMCFRSQCHLPCYNGDETLVYTWHCYTFNRFCEEIARHFTGVGGWRPPNEKAGPQGPNKS